MFPLRRTRRPGSAVHRRGSHLATSRRPPRRWVHDVPTPCPRRPVPAVPAGRRPPGSAGPCRHRSVDLAAARDAHGAAGVRPARTALASRPPRSGPRRRPGRHRAGRRRGAGGVRRDRGRRPRGDRRARHDAHHLPPGGSPGRARRGGPHRAGDRHAPRPPPALRAAALPALGAAARPRLPRPARPAGEGGRAAAAAAPGPVRPGGGPGGRRGSAVRRRRACRAGCWPARRARGSPGRCAGRRRR